MSTSTTSASTPKVGFLTRWFFSLLERNLPRKFKRLIYVSSILGLFEQMKDPDMTLVKKLNDTFKLAEYPDAFAFPMYIKSVIWKGALNEPVELHTREKVSIGELINQELNSKDCMAIGEYFATRTPKWLSYGSIDLMANDIVLLVKELKQFKVNPVQHAMA